MLLPLLVLPLVLVVIVLSVQRAAMPAFLALMAGALAYGLLADRQLHAFGRAFSLGFTNAMEQVGVFVVAGAALIAVSRTCPLPRAWAWLLGLIVGTTTTPAGALSLMNDSAGPPRRALLVVLLAIAARAVAVPSAVAVATVWIAKAELRLALVLGVPLAAIAASVAWRTLQSTTQADDTTGRMSRSAMILIFLMALMLVHAIAQVPSEPFGKNAANALFTNLGQPFVIATLGLLAAFALTRGRHLVLIPDGVTASLLLTVGAAGGFSFVLNETGAPELAAELFLDHRLGLLVPFLAAATVKTIQGGSLTAALTAAGMTEPMLASLGLDTSDGRLLAAFAAGAGSTAVCHLNDPLFWVGAHVTRLPLTRALVAIGGGSTIIAASILGLLLILRPLV